MSLGYFGDVKNTCFEKEISTCISVCSRYSAGYWNKKYIFESNYTYKGN